MKKEKDLNLVDNIERYYERNTEHNKYEIYHELNLIKEQTENLLNTINILIKNNSEKVVVRGFKLSTNSTK